MGKGDNQRKGGNGEDGEEWLARNVGRGSVAGGGSGRREGPSTVIAIDSIKDFGEETRCNSLEDAFGVIE